MYVCTSRGTSTTLSHIWRCSARHGTSSTRAAKTSSAPLTQFGRMSIHAPADNGVRRVPARPVSAGVVVCADRKSVVWGKSVLVRVDPGGRRNIKKHKTTTGQKE